MVPTPSQPEPKRKTKRREYRPVRTSRTSVLVSQLLHEEIEKFDDIPRQTIQFTCEKNETLSRTARPGSIRKYKISLKMVLETEADMNGKWCRGSMETQELINFYYFDCVVNAFEAAFERGNWVPLGCAEEVLLQSNMEEGEEFRHNLHDKMSWALNNHQHVLYSNVCHFVSDQKKKKKVYRR